MCRECKICDFGPFFDYILLILNLRCKFLSASEEFIYKDIDQAKKRGVKRGANRFVLTVYTIAVVFLKGHSFSFKFQKTSAFEGHKSGVLFCVMCAAKKLRRVL